MRIAETARADIAGAIGDLDHISVAELMRVLEPRDADASAGASAGMRASTCGMPLT